MIWTATTISTRMVNDVAKPKYITYNGEMHTIAEWARLFDMSRKTLDYRIKIGDMSDFEWYFRHGGTPKTKDSVSRAYISEKIRMLEGGFRIWITPEEKAHFYQLETEIAVDNYAHDILIKKLYKEDF